MIISGKQMNIRIKDVFGGTLDLTALINKPDGCLKGKFIGYARCGLLQIQHCRVPGIKFREGIPIIRILLSL